MRVRDGTCSFVEVVISDGLSSSKRIGFGINLEHCYAHAGPKGLDAENLFQTAIPTV